MDTQNTLGIIKSVHSGRSHALLWQVDVVAERIVPSNERQNVHISSSKLEKYNVARNEVVLCNYHKVSGRLKALTLEREIDVLVFIATDGSYRVRLLRNMYSHLVLKVQFKDPICAGFYSLTLCATEEGSSVEAGTIQELTYGNSLSYKDSVAPTIALLVKYCGAEKVFSDFWPAFVKLYYKMEEHGILMLYLTYLLRKPNGFDQIRNTVSDFKRLPNGVSTLDKLHLKTNSVTFQYALLLAGVIDDCPILDTQQKVDEWKFCMVTGNTDDLWLLLKEMVRFHPCSSDTHHTLTSLLEQGVCKVADAECQEWIAVFKAMPLLEWEIKLRPQHFEASEECLIKFWIADLIEEVSDEFLHSFCAEKEPTLIAALVTEAPIEKALQLLECTPALEELRHKKALELLFTHPTSPSALVIDIESNGELVREIAWQFQGKIESAPLANAIVILNGIIQDHNPILIGHNILKWDLAILKNKGLLFEESLVVDTLF